MTVKTALVAVGTSPTVLVAPFTGVGHQSVMVVNGGSITVFIGGPDVAVSGSTQGVPLAVGASLSADLAGGTSNGDGLFGIVVSGSGSLTVMRGGA